LGWLSPALPDLPEGLANLATIPTFFDERPVSSVTRRIGVSVGQNLYTPADTETSAPKPTIGLTFERRWRTNRGVIFEDPEFEYDVAPRLGMALGNAATYASAGGTLRIGKELRNDFGPARARPALPGSEGFIGEGLRLVLLRRRGRRGGSAQHLPRRQHQRPEHRCRGAPAVPRRGADRPHRPIPWRAHQLQAGSAHARIPQRDRWDQFGSINVTFRY
jgi:lipid A 3-O-deacylase